MHPPPNTNSLTKGAFLPYSLLCLQSLAHYWAHSKISKNICTYSAQIDFFLVLKSKTRTSYMLDMCSTTQPYAWLRDKSLLK